MSGDLSGEDRGRWRGIRYRSVSGNGQLWSTPTNLYFIELAAGLAAQQAAIYDHTRYPQNLITQLNATAESKSEPFPPKDVTLKIERGVYVSYSAVGVAITGPVTLGFSP
jgi:hypothetical protein